MIITNPPRTEVEPADYVKLRLQHAAPHRPAARLEQLEIIDRRPHQLAVVVQPREGAADAAGNRCQRLRGDLTCRAGCAQLDQRGGLTPRRRMLTGKVRRATASGGSRRATATPGRSMANTSTAFGRPDGSHKATLGYNAESASGRTTGGDRARRRARSWMGSSMAAPSPSLEKADHACTKWNVLMPSTAESWTATPNTTPPHLRKVT